jgi:uncharacterized phage protein (TIGR02218 family)
LPAHFAGSGSAAVCAYIVSAIGATVFASTTWSTSLTGVPGFPGVTFKSTSGMTGSSVEAQPAKATNLEADLFLVSAGISEADALSGKWFHSAVTVILLDPENPNKGYYIIAQGYLGQFVQRGQMLTTEIMGYLQNLQQQYGKVTRAECFHEFGDSGCTLNLSGLGFVKTGTLTGVTSQTVFADSSRTEADDYFGNGFITFTSGNNNGFTFQIDSWVNSTKTFTLRTPTPYLPVNGDAYSAKRGCRKRASDCTGYSNIVNFGGFPFVPTVEDLTRLPLQ